MPKVALWLFRLVTAPFPERIGGQKPASAELRPMLESQSESLSHYARKAKRQLHGFSMAFRKGTMGGRHTWAAGPDFASRSDTFEIDLFGVRATMPRSGHPRRNLGSSSCRRECNKGRIPLSLPSRAE